MQIPYVSNGFVELAFFAIDFAKENDLHNNQDESELPSPEILLETLMVGVFVMGGSERLGIMQQEFISEFGNSSTQNFELMNEKVNREIFTINEVHESQLSEESKK